MPSGTSNVFNDLLWLRQFCMEQILDNLITGVVCYVGADSNVVSLESAAMKKV